MSKKILSVLLAVIMVISIAPIVTFAEEHASEGHSTTDGDIYCDNCGVKCLNYRIDNNEAIITHCYEKLNSIVIPETIENCPVTTLEYCIFSSSGLKDIVISENVKSVGGAFIECSTVEKIYLPDSVTDIHSFNYCFSLKEIRLPQGLTKLPTFWDCDSLTEIDIPDSVTTIPMYAFDRCDNLKTVTIPEGVTVIEEGTFEGCTSLKNITLPDSLRSIEEQAFSKCSSLTSIDIPEGVTTIGYMAFYSCNSLVNVILPDSLTSIGDYAFACTAIKSIRIPDNISALGAQTFRACVYLEEVILPKNLQTCDMPFIDCISLSFDGIILPDGIDYIPDSLYKGVYIGLKSASLPDTIKTIGSNAFEGCSLLSSVDIPENVEYIGAYAFADCWTLESITLYNKDIVLDEMSIGYSSMIITGDKKEFSSLCTEYYSLFVENPDAEELNEMALKLESMMNGDHYPERLPIPDFTIYGYEGSTAETYANENGFNFVPIESHNYVDTVITPATYTKTGVGGMVCEHCGDVQSIYEIPMLEIEDSDVVADKKNDISVYFPEGTFDGDVEVEVTPVEEGEAYKLISHKEGNFKVTMFDINITADGQKVQPNGTVLVQIPLPKGYNQNKCAVYYVADDGTMEELKTYHYKDGYVYFETDHFSYYAILENTEEDNNQESLSFLDKVVLFLKRIVEFFKKLFFEATGRA